jgi:uncharacterized protein (DUF488 family)
LILTIGHSTRPIEEFIAILKAHSIDQLVDIRTIPKSRHNPQFAREALEASLSAADIRYEHMAALGGLRRPRADSINTGWRNVSFRGYADYMQTSTFIDSLETLIGLAGRSRTAIMCAEAVPWRCHRSLVADALVVRNIQVEHIDSATRSHPHKLTPFARVTGIDIQYPKET